MWAMNPGRVAVGIAALLLLILPMGTVAQGTPSDTPGTPGTPSTPGAAGPPVGTVGTNLIGDTVTWFIDPQSSARQEADEWRQSRLDDATLMDKIAGQPVADWMGNWVPDIKKGVDDRVTQITAAGALPILVAYDIPYRDCGLYSAGGENDPDAYRAWISAFAAGIGDRPAVVILEPDGLTLTDCLSGQQTSERFALLKDAAETLGANPQTDVYIDSGHSAWLDPAEAARRLHLAGIDDAAGFSLNVSHFQTTADPVAYGKKVSDAVGLGGTHFVIDTSRNGNGPWQSDDPEAWCNPPGRALGECPTLDAADLLADALDPQIGVGQRVGACHGGPEAGQWWADYALELAKNAHWN